MGKHTIYFMHLCLSSVDHQDGLRNNIENECASETKKCKGKSTVQIARHDR